MSKAMSTIRNKLGYYEPSSISFSQLPPANARNLNSIYDTVMAFNTTSSWGQLGTFKLYYNNVVCNWIRDTTATPNRFYLGTATFNSIGIAYFRYNNGYLQWNTPSNGWETVKYNYFLARLLIAQAGVELINTGSVYMITSNGSTNNGLSIQGDRSDVNGTTRYYLRADMLQDGSTAFVWSTLGGSTFYISLNL